MEEAAGRSGAMGDKDQRKELDSMLSSLGVAPVAGKLPFIKGRRLWQSLKFFIHWVIRFGL